MLAMLLDAAVEDGRLPKNPARPADQGGRGRTSCREAFRANGSGTCATPPHGLRHTAANIAVQAGAKMKVVQQMLGHEDAAMRLNGYADLFDAELDDVAERMDAAYRTRASASSPVPIRVSGSGA